MADLEPKPLTPGQRTLRQGASLLAADIAGNVVGVNVLSQMDNIEKAAPVLTSSLRGVIKSAITKPFLKPLEGMLTLSKGIEGEKEYAKRMQLSEEVRADNLAKGITRWGLAEAAGWGSMLGVNLAINKAMNVPVATHKTLQVYCTDIAVHAGAIAILGSPVVAPLTQSLKGVFCKIFKGIGHTDEKANDMANFTVTMILPNYVALGASVALLHKINKDAAKNLLTHK